MADKKQAEPQQNASRREKSTRQKQAPAYRANMSSRLRARWGDKAWKQQALAKRAAKQKARK